MIERKVIPMKKLFALLLSVMLMLSLAALAEIEFDRASPVTDWEGEWTLTGAFIGEEYADENDIAAKGDIEVPANLVTMSVKALLDASASGSDAGVMVDQAAYIHAHVYDMEATVAFDAGIAEETATLRLPWDGLAMRRSATRCGTRSW